MTMELLRFIRAHGDLPGGSLTIQAKTQTIVPKSETPAPKAIGALWSLRVVATFEAWVVVYRMFLDWDLGAALNGCVL